ncbi:hypothetical protein [Mesoplasma seiffertii]|uniref:hypothetical protein n=1 Tax=Mesoplasma seiffertii TaxID=28224 RepID=UPI000478C618|nr:hypothetical protein [Mesoplasma seiffertii]
MLNRQDSIFWVYFSELAKKTSNPIYKKNSIDLKTRVNEIFNVTYYGIFQYQLVKGEAISMIPSEKIKDLSQYIINNYKVLHMFTYQNKAQISKYVNMSEEDRLFLSETIEKFVIPYINDNSFYTKDSFAASANAKFTILTTLAFKHEYDINYINSAKTRQIFHGLSYPLLMTMLICDVTRPEEMFDRIKKVYTPANIDRALLYGRDLTSEEHEYISPELEKINHEDDFFGFIVNFQEKEWSQLSLNERYKYLFQLSKYTALFLKENIKSIEAFGNEEEVLELVYNYLPVLLSTNQENLEVELNTLDSSKAQVKEFLLPYLNKDQNIKQIWQHLNSIKDYKHLRFAFDDLVDFVFNVKYATAYLELVYRTKRNNGIIGDFLIDCKKVAIVNTLKFYKQEKDQSYSFVYSNVKYNMINLDIKNIERLLTPVNRFQELADKKSEMSIMLRIISLVLAMEPKSARQFGYSWQIFVKYYIIAFGPYKKQKAVFDNKTFKTVEAKINKLLNQYEFLKQKELVIDSIYLIYKLANFKN